MLAFVTATAKEMKAALAFAGAPRVEQGDAVPFELGGRELLLTVSGVGLVNSAMTAGRLLGRGDVDGVLNVGIAGAYDTDDCPLGATAYVWQETWPEYGLLDEGGAVDPKGIGFPQGAVNGKPVWNRVKLVPVNHAEALGLTLGERWLRAASVSVNSVTGTAERAGWLKTACNADIENMEGFALAFAAMQAGLPFLEVRTISNLVGSRSERDWNLKGAFRGLEQACRTLFGI